jgi:hypothetical protein
MRFAGLTIWTTLAGLGMALGTVALLHLLRTQAERVSVVTTLFWRETRAASRARTLLHRLRNWPSFLLIASITALLVLSLNGSMIRGSVPRSAVIVVDAGASMGAFSGKEQRIEEAKHAALRMAAGFRDSDHLAVIACDPLPRLVQRFEEPVASARSHIPEMGVGDGPPQSAAALRLASDLLAGHPEGQIYWITDQDTTAPLPDRVVYVPVGTAAENAAVLGATFVPENDPTKGRVHARVGWWGQKPAGIPIQLKLQASGDTVLQSTLSIRPGETREVITEPISADGSTVRVEINQPDALASDNSLEYTLPRRMPLIIGVDPQLPQALQIALLAVPAQLVTTSAPAACTILATRGTAASPVPCIRVVSDGPPVPLGTPARLGDDDRPSTVAGAGSSVHAPETGSLDVLGRAGELPIIALWHPPSGPQQLLIGDCVFAPGSTVVTEPRFALDVRRVVRGMGGWSDEPTVLSARQKVEDPLILGARMPQPASAVAPDRQSSNTWGRAATPTSPSAASGGMGSLPLQPLLLLAALAGILADALLHARGRVV